VETSSRPIHAAPDYSWQRTLTALLDRGELGGRTGRIRQPGVRGSLTL
jgi:hypothetical protein